jgi:hypothetical protein
MTRFARLFLAAVMALSVVSAFVRRSPEPLEVPDGRKSEAGPGAIGEALPEVAFLRRFAKDFVAGEVVEGRRSAVEAAAVFRELDRLRPTPEEILQPAGGAIPIPDEERYRQQVINWVSAFLPEEPRHRAEAVLARVEAEFREASRETGALQLPAVAGLEPVEQLLARVKSTLTAAQRNVLPHARRPQ